MTMNVETVRVETELRHTEEELRATIDELESRHRFMMAIVDQLAHHGERCFLAAELMSKKCAVREEEMKTCVVDLLAVVAGSPCCCGNGCAPGSCLLLPMDELRAPLIQLAVGAGVVRAP
jgi:hypothetical protein